MPALSIRNCTTVVARAVDSSQLERKRGEWIGRSSVCPSTRIDSVPGQRGPHGGQDVARRRRQFGAAKAEGVQLADRHDEGVLLPLDLDATLGECAGE